MRQLDVRESSSNLLHGRPGHIAESLWDNSHGGLARSLLLGTFLHLHGVRIFHHVAQPYQLLAKHSCNGLSFSILSSTYKNLKHIL